jgi:hypothetical protein
MLNIYHLASKTDLDDFLLMFFFFIYNAVEITIIIIRFFVDTI